MKTTMKITKKTTSDKLIINLSFKEEREVYPIIILCSVAAYFMQDHEITINDYSIFIDDKVVARIENTSIILERTLISNDTMVFIGIQTYLNIYFNLYDTNQYNKIETFYEELKKK